MTTRGPSTANRRFYTPPATPPEDLDRPEKSALVAIKGLRPLDPVNPPRSTRPPDLALPKRGEENVALYYFRVGRAYGSFYWVGIKAVWFNFQATRLLKERIKKDAEGEEKKTGEEWLRLVKRSEFQLLERNSHDIGKLPLFGVLVALLGEWLPLLVPFMPGVVPGTCCFPKQLEGMRKKAEERRRRSFRQGISEPSKEQISEISDATVAADWPMTGKDYAASKLKGLRDDQLYHLSCALDLHNRMWDRVQLPPPSWLLRRGLSKRLAYLTKDDKLLTRDGGAPRLSSEEMIIACEQRGLDVLGKREEVLRNDLTWWLARQHEDRGKGNAIFTMLFRRLAMREWVQLNVKANS
ncbi:hypothetical protein M409DRAFT_66667 [Zasmidium cellare ATCC 36951]|uniref:Letm1 RBD domain-containing protein n=1 Tax=Zasmidium cellare ATCC 36951 TaxID=1080233 RepID=A0A6A6CFX6_ZASCE|nr:uncharacterized protein M409DRAFT_66667 [Zasmidium cellare ATCC 36951]KAF2166147.1 hypothetical protein M409DRAFT_66667 [Zasmidium cellare ATCC 36951]